MYIDCEKKKRKPHDRPKSEFKLSVVFIHNQHKKTLGNRRTCTRIFRYLFYTHINLHAREKKKPRGKKKANVNRNQLSI